jgi:hypothetical protein
MSVKVYYLGTKDAYNATNSGEDGLVLKSDYDKLEAKLKIARDALEFYAQTENWLKNTNGYRGAISDDYEPIKSLASIKRYGGRRARTALKQLEEK